MRKVLIILLVLSAWRTLVSCCKNGYDFRWGKVTLTSINISGDPPILLTSNVVKANDLGFRLRFHDERVASAKSFSFCEANAAYDCWALFQNMDSITTLDMTTRFTFDDTHPAGSSLIDYLQARRTDYYNYKPKPEFEPIRNNLYFLNENQLKFLDDNSLDIRLATPPAKSGQHRFIINILFASGRMLSDSTTIIVQ